MENDYPTEDELTRIKKWHFPISSEGEFERAVEDLVGFIKEIWHWPDWGFSFNKQKQSGAWRLTLHTGGWSGNESIIGALEESFIFWSMFWKLTRRGGHYYFDTEMTKKKWIKNAG